MHSEIGRFTAIVDVKVSNGRTSMDVQRGVTEKWDACSTSKV